MEHDHEKEPFEAAAEEKEEGYVPRPAWQVWGARVGLVLFLLFVVWQLMQIAGGFQ